MRQGKDRVEGAYGQELCVLFLQPAGFGQGLAFGAVAVSTRVIGGVFKATQVALLHVATQ